MERQWHQLNHMQIACILLQSDNHTSMSSSMFYRPDILPGTENTNTECQWCSTNSLLKLVDHNSHQHAVSSVKSVHFTLHMYTHTHPFHGPLSRTTWVSWYQKGKPICILLKQETVSGSGISWAVYKSAYRHHCWYKPLFNSQLTHCPAYHFSWHPIKSFLQSTEGI